MIVPKIQLEENDLRLIEMPRSALGFKSKHMREGATLEKAHADRRRLRETQRQRAMEAYGGDFENVFEEVEDEDFEIR